MCQKTFNKKYFRFLMISLLFWVLAGITQGVSAGPEERCLDCHEDTWEEGRAKMYVHQPFQEQQCQTCHVDSPSEIEKQQRNQQSSQERSQVKWISRNFTPVQTHWFKFSAPKDHGALFIEAGADRGKMLQHKSPLPALGDLPRYDNDYTAPMIYNVKVLEVKKGLFLSAVISWETDEIANSVVNYGIKKLNISSPLENSFTSRHQVTLAGIKSKKTYQVKGVSEDLFGNRATSDLFTLSTDKAFSLLEEQPLTAISDFKEIEINTEFFQSDDLYLAKITANQPVKLALGSLPTTFKKASYVKDANSPQDIKHVLTKDEFHLNISICYGCHRQYQEGMSHPVNVYPKRGIIIPPEYPTLPDGRMTCMSCHAKHASNLKNRVIKSSKKELCVGCHKDMD